jgi:hypothetical protein
MAITPDEKGDAAIIVLIAAVVGKSVIPVLEGGARWD